MIESLMPWLYVVLGRDPASRNSMQLTKTSHSGFKSVDLKKELLKFNVSSPAFSNYGVL